MMRELKFRIWDGKSMSEPFGLYDIDMDNSCRYYFGGHKCYGDEILMQYTGLSDKNGVEIYEGDILGGYPHGTITVYWDEKYACYSCVDTDNDIDYGIFSQQLRNCGSGLEIIGNIHENKSLLDDQ